MFQSDDDITFDTEFLSDTFDLASTTSSAECAKRHSEESEPQLAPKTCTSQNTLDVLSLLKSKAKKPGEIRSEHRFARPVLPCKKRRVVQRRFPGPAGILPAQRDVNIDVNQLENEKNDRNDSDEMVCSQQSDDIFTRPAWRRMLQDLGSTPGDTAPGVGLPERYTIAWAKTRASRRQLNGGRTPFLAAVVQQIDCSTRNPMALLKDQTGEIQATLIHELWQEYGDQLHTGAVILLRQVGVLSTAKQHYLAVTLSNLFAIYSDDPAVTRVNYMTSRDFIKTLADIRNADKMAEKPCENSAGLLSTAPCPLNDSSEPRRDTRVRNDKEDDRAALHSNAECSRNSAARSSTRNVNSPGLFSTAEQLRSDRQARRDTPARSTTHNAARGLLSNAKHTSNSHADSIISETSTFLRPDFDSTTEKSSKMSQESEMLSQIFDGLDAESIFDDF